MGGPAWHMSGVREENKELLGSMTEVNGEDLTD